MILRALPPETLATDLAEFEATGAAATEISLPMNMVLGQLPSGKVEMTVQDLVPHIPPGFLKPAEEIGSYLPALVALPLMDVVMRIPPDLLALRPDQRSVDPSVASMADPFTQDILREQAEANRAAAAAATAAAAAAPSQPNIIDESQVPVTEEFVPRDQTPVVKNFVPPNRNTSPTPVPAPMNAHAIVPPSRVPSSGPLPPVPTLVRNSSPVPPPAPTTMSRQIAPSGNLPVPIRPSSPMPARAQAAPTAPVAIPMPVKTGMAPPFPGGAARPTTPLPTPPRPTSVMPSPQAPQPPLRPSMSLAKALGKPTGSVPTAAPSVPTVPPVPVAKSPAFPSPIPVPVTAVPGTPIPTVIPRPISAAPAANPSAPVPVAPTVAPTIPATAPTIPAIAPVPPVAPAPAPEEPKKEEASAAAPVSVPAPGQPDAAAAELQRLGALAMQQMQDQDAKSEAKAESFIVPPEPKAESFIIPPEVKPDPAPVASATAEAPSLPPASSSLPTAGEAIAASAVALAAAAPAIESKLSAPKPISTPAPASAPAAAAATPAEAAPVQEGAAFNLNNCTVADLLKIPGCTTALAESIVKQRNKIGSFKRLEDLLEVPGMTGAAYKSLTGETAPQAGVPLSIAELLGFPEEQKVTLKDVTDRICCWPDVTGCILGQSTGLSLVGSVPKNFDKSAIVAFAPRMFESINKSFGEIAGKETNELIIPTAGTSFHILRNGDLYLIILSRLPQMPDRHVKIARLVLAGLQVQVA